METLGRHGAPGPLVGTYLVTALVDDEVAAPIADGRTLVSVGQGTLFPWAPVAGVFVSIDGDQAWRVQPAGAIEPLTTTVGEPWGRFEPVAVESL
ncbi:MAG TPA: hypothetical protein PLV68_02875, partial [Ilumatobacteraceae bacterium]|nr:hypothetical protein [Ilumatobacteraceae bacterium]